MKQILYILALFMFPMITSGQEPKNKITISTPIKGYVDYGYRSGVDGGGSFQNKGFYAINIDYSREILRNLEVVGGISFTHNRIETESAFYPDIDMTPSKDKINMITIPIQVRYTFLRYLFVNGGVAFNLKTSDTSSFASDDIDNLGLLAGIGGKYSFQRIEVSANPYFQAYNIKSSRYTNFNNVGVKFGVGYKF